MGLRLRLGLLPALLLLLLAATGELQALGRPPQRQRYGKGRAGPRGRGRGRGWGWGRGRGGCGTRRAHSVRGCAQQGR